MPKPTVGLTGGIASGKSTVADLFRELGIPVIDADALAREVVHPGTEALAEIVQTFGEDVLTVEGTLDREALGRIVFGDPRARARLNAITHPRIARHSAERMQELQDTDASYLLYEAALLVENEIHDRFDAVIVVAATEKTQLRRLVERDRTDEHAAWHRIASQHPLENKTRVADFVIWNDGDLDDTRRQVARVHQSLTARFHEGEDEDEQQSR